METVEFDVPYPVGWKGRNYRSGVQKIPQDLALVLGWQPEKEVAQLPAKRKAPKNFEE